MLYESFTVLDPSETFSGMLLDYHFGYIEGVRQAVRPNAANFVGCSDSLAGSTAANTTPHRRARIATMGTDWDPQLRTKHQNVGGMSQIPVRY
jgi:hypothetical protein